MNIVTEKRNRLLYDRKVKLLCIVPMKNHISVFISPKIIIQNNWRTIALISSLLLLVLMISISNSVTVL